LPTSHDGPVPAWIVSRPPYCELPAYFFGLDEGIAHTGRFPLAHVEGTESDPLMALWFTADTHFGHAAIIRLGKRPFGSVDEMDEALIANWNAVVRKSDEVWHLGDFNYRSALGTADYLSRLNGRVSIIWGNHDDEYARKEFNLSENRRGLSFNHDRPLFAAVYDTYYLRYQGERIMLSHYAHRVWRGSHKGAWHLFGHSHGGIPNLHRSMDVGVDCHDYRPVAFDTIRAYMVEQPVTAHHPELPTDPIS
jgi:calcineurin-like phosphoesterase family protein